MDSVCLWYIAARQTRVDWVVVVIAAFTSTRLLAQFEVEVGASLLGLRVREALDAPIEPIGIPGDALVVADNVRATAGASAAGGAALRGNNAMLGEPPQPRCCVIDAWLEAPQGLGTSGPAVDHKDSSCGDGG